MPTTRPPAPNPATIALQAQAIGLLQAGRVAQARSLCEQFAREQPGAAEPRQLLGMIAARDGDFAAAVRWLGEALALRPDDAPMQNNHGVALRKLGRDAEAIDAFRRAVALRPDYADAFFNLGNAQRDAGDSADALAAYSRAATLRPEHAAAWNAQAAVLLRLQRPEDALAAAARAAALAPDDAEPHVNAGAALAMAHRYEDALAALDRALALNPRHAAARANRGGVLLSLRRIDDAIAELDRALALDPAQPDALDARADAATQAKRHDEAASCYQRLLALAPDHPFARGNLLHARMLAADWREVDTLAGAVAQGLREGRPEAEPFGYQGIATDEAALRRCAELYAAREYPPVTAARPDAAAAPAPVPAPAQTPHDRITVGYLCGEFRQHATTLLMAGVFEAHDRTRFRLVAFDNGGPDASDERRRVEAAFDTVVDLRRLSDAQAAERVRAEGVDILVNLNGYYGAHRMGVFAHRPAPVQVNYLGFPGTLGAPYIDYIVADPTVLPPESQPHYAEQVVWLPDSYQANDNRRAIADSQGQRADHGLPDGAFVFCCFNNSYKITPATFDRWMDVLRQVSGSVLWLLDDKPGVAGRLRQQAQARGVDGARLVFAPLLPPAEHLARHAFADLGLDSLPYNAHTTGSDALWAGLPFVTQLGTTFPGRVGASLLRAAGLPELVTHDDVAFVQLAVALALDAPRLAALRARLKGTRGQCALFDTPRFTRHLEQAFETMVARQRAGLPPQAFAVPAQPNR